MSSGAAATNWHSSLAVSTVDTVTLPAGTETVQVLNRSGTAEIYYTVDGTAPTVGGANCRVLVAAICADQAGPYTTPAPSGVVKLISPGTPTYSVIAGL